MSSDESNNSSVYTIQKRRRSYQNGSPNVIITRAPFTQTEFDDLHQDKITNDQQNGLGTLEKLRENIYCSNRRLWKLVTLYLPIVKFIRYYNLKENAVTDIVAGLTVGVLHIPQALAFGALTSVKVENGLFTSLWPVLLYVIFGTSAHVSMGTSAVICILTAATIDREALAWADARPWILNQTLNGTSIDDVPEYLDFKEQLAMGIALTSGLMMVAMGMLKLGFITAYLSESFFTAFTSAAAVHIGTSQIPAMLGIKTPRFGGVFKIIYSYEAIFEVITEANVAAIICALLTCVIIQLVKDCINERYKHKLYAPIPIELFVVIIGTLISHFGNFHGNFDVVVVGTIPTKIQPPVVPVDGLKYASNYIVDSFILAILIFANTIAMAKICAKKHNYEINDSQEMIAYGMCNAVSSFFKCFPSSVAPPRSMVASSMNAKTTLNGIFTSILMILLILIISPLFQDLPKAILGAIIFIALKGLFVQILDGRKFWKINKFDFVIWFFTFFSTVFLDIDLGLGIGVCVSLLTVVFQTQFSRGYKIGYTKTDSALVEHEKYKDSSEVPGVKIFRFQSSLYFANAEIFRNTLYRCTVNPRKLLKGLKKREKRLSDINKTRQANGLPPENRKNSIMLGEATLVSSESNPSIGQFSVKDTIKNAEGIALSKNNNNVTTNTKPEARKASLPCIDNPAFRLDEDKEVAGFNNGKSPVEPVSFSKLQTSIKRPESLNGSYGNNGGSESLNRRMSTFSINFDDYQEDPNDGGEMFSDDKLRRMRKVHHVVVDCSTINYLDASGANVLSHIYTEYGHVNIELFLAGCSWDMRRAMDQAGVFQKIPRGNLFIDVHDAVAVAKPLKTLPLLPEALDDYSDDEAIEESYVTKVY